MKKTLGMIVAAAVIATGCSAVGDPQNSANETEVVGSVAEGEQEGKGGSEEKGGGVEVDKKLLNVSITLPASMFEGQDMDQVIADAKEEGVTDVVKNDDGSVTYTMSKSDHSKLLKEMSDGIASYAEELAEEDTFASIKKIEYNKSFSEFSMIVDKEKYENSMDGLVSMGLGMQGVLYQTYEGVDSGKQKVTVNIQDESTGEVFHTIVYPDALMSE